MNNYQKYRGKCKEMAEKAVSENAELELVKGWYDDPIWGRQAHWWTMKPNGEIYDPTKKQFPSGGIAEFYIPFSGTYPCEFCGKEVLENDGYPVEHHFYCSYSCYGKDVMG